MINTAKCSTCFYVSKSHLDEPCMSCIVADKVSPLHRLVNKGPHPDVPQAIYEAAMDELAQDEKDLERLHNTVHKEDDYNG